jgi:MFS family permease
MSDWLPERKRGFAQGITHSSSRLGTAVTPPLLAWLIAITSWRGSFILLGVVSLCWALAWGSYFRDDRAEHPRISSRELDTLPKYPSPAERGKISAPWRRLAQRMFPVTAVYFLLRLDAVGISGADSLFFLHGYHLDLARSALFSAGVVFAGVVGDTLGGITSRHHSHPDRRPGFGSAQSCGGRFSLLAGFNAACLDLLTLHKLTLVGDLPEPGILRFRIHYRAHVGNPDGYRAAVFWFGQRSDEYWIASGRNCFSPGFRIRNRQDRRCISFPRSAEALHVAGSPLFRESG